MIELSLSDRSNCIIHQGRGADQTAVTQDWFDLSLVLVNQYEN